MGKALYSKRLGRVVASKAQHEGSGNYHVVSSDSKKWVVIREGTVHSVRAFSTQRQAISYAKRRASKRTGDVIVHAQSGLVKEMISYAKK